MIREKLLRTLNKEVPHGTAVVIEEFTEEEGLIRIRAEIFCEKASHKGIIVGKGGAGLKLAWNQNFIVSIEVAHNFNKGIGDPFWMSIGTNYCF